MIKVELKGFDEAMAVLDSQVVKAAAYQAINRTVNGMRTDFSIEARKTYNVKKSDIDNRIKVNKAANYDNLTGSVSISGESRDRKFAIPLIMFGAVGRKNLTSGSAKTLKGKHGFYSQALKRKGAEGVGFKIMKSGKLGFKKNLFMIPGGGGSMQVVRRIGKGKNALQEQRVITLASMVGSKKHGVIDRILKQASERFEKNFQATLKFFSEQASLGLFRGGQRRYRR